MELVGGQPSHPQRYENYITFALTMQLKKRHTLCWSAPLQLYQKQISFLISSCSTRQPPVFLPSGPPSRYLYIKFDSLFVLLCQVDISQTLAPMETVLSAIGKPWRGEEGCTYQLEFINLWTQDKSCNKFMSFMALKTISIRIKGKV